MGITPGTLETFMARGAQQAGLVVAHLAEILPKHSGVTEVRHSGDRLYVHVAQLRIFYRTALTMGDAAFVEYGYHVQTTHGIREAVVGEINAGEWLEQADFNQGANKLLHQSVYQVVGAVEDLGEKARIIDGTVTPADVQAPAIWE
jgi:hypothetical protein